MDPLHQLNEAEIAEALSGQAPEARLLASCEGCSTEFAEWSELGGKLRAEFHAQADMPGYFWARQQARIRQRLEPGPMPLRAVLAGILALLVVACGLILAPVQPSQPQVSQASRRPADQDDVLLEEIQASLQKDVPGPLMPAAVLVQELTNGPMQDQKVKED